MSYKFSLEIFSIENGVEILKVSKDEQSYYVQMAKGFQRHVQKMYKDLGLEQEPDNLACDLFWLIHNNSAKTAEDLKIGILFPLSDKQGLENPSFQVLAVWSYWLKGQIFDLHRANQAINLGEILKKAL